MNGAEQEGHHNIQGNANRLQHVGGNVQGNVHAGDIFQGPVQMVFNRAAVREEKEAREVAMYFFHLGVYVKGIISADALTKRGMPYEAELHSFYNNFSQTAEMISFPCPPLNEITGNINKFCRNLELFIYKHQGMPADFFNAGNCASDLMHYDSQYGPEIYRKSCDLLLSIAETYGIRVKVDHWIKNIDRTKHQQELDKILNIFKALTLGHVQGRLPLEQDEPKSNWRCSLM